MNKLEYALFNVFHDNCSNDSFYKDVYDYITFNDNIMYKYYLQVDLSNPNNIEVPAMIGSLVESTIIKKIRDNIECEKMLCPLFSDTLPLYKRTGNTIITTLFSSPIHNRLASVITASDDKIYGGRGIILNENFKPLLLCTIKGQIIIDENGIKRFKYIKPIIRVNPSVFIDNKKIINKAIINTVLPYYCNRTVSRNTYSSLINYFSKKPTVIIEDFDDCIVSPNKPSIADTQDTFNQVLIDNIDEICNLIKG